MVVRPLQPDSYGIAGMPSTERVLRHRRAGQRLQSITRTYVKDTDEYIVKIPPGYDENSLSLALIATGDYEYAEPDWILYPLRTPNDPRYTQQWHHPRVQSPQAWDIVIGRSSQIVAVVDTGIDLTHPDLSANRVPGYNSVDRRAEVDGGQVADLGGHGTHVAGCAAAIGNNGVGVAGMGWTFRIMMVRTSNSPGGGASGSDIMAGARWAADNGAKTVSASYSGVDSATVGTTGTYIKRRNALFFYAAGNDNRDLDGFYWPDTIVVGSTTSTDAKSGFSAYGRGVHVFAPGSNILSTTRGGGYGQSSGTSMATPVANGVAALIWAANPDLTAQQVQDILGESCDNIGPSTIFGRGRVNSFRGVQRAIAQLGNVVFPTTIQTTEGFHVRGGPGDVTSPTSGHSYDVNSVGTQLGQVAAVTMTYNANTTPGQLLSLRFSYLPIETPATLVTGMLYAWNYSTQRWDLIGQFPVASSGTAVHERTINANPARYLGPGGTVRTMFRAVSTTRGNRLPPMSYQLRLRYARLVVGALP